MGNVVLSLHREWKVYTVAGLLDVGDGILARLFLTANCVLLYCHTTIYPFIIDIIIVSYNISHRVWDRSEVDYA